MAHTPPVSAVGAARLQLLAPDTTPYSPAKYLSADGATWNHSKAPDGSALSFDASVLEAVLAADKTILEDAFAILEVDEGGVWTAKGMPFALAPGTGEVLGAAEKAAESQSPIAVGALQALASECVVLPNECDDDSPTMRYACGIEGNLYRGWQSKGFTEGTAGETWHDADVYTPTAGSAKEGEPSGWDAEAESAEFVFRDADEGGLTLLRFPTFELEARTVVKFIVAADEESKIYLDGPNNGGVIIDSSANETGYTDKNVWKKRLEPGIYRPAGEFTIVDSEGGDGNDSIRFACGTIDDKGNIATVLSKSDASTRVLRQSKNDERPGFTPGELLRRLLQENSDLGVDAADILLDNRTFTDADDSSSAAWSTGREYVWPLGTSLASVLVDLVEDCDLDLSSTFEFGAWEDRGADVSASVILKPGASPATADMNIVSWSWNSDPQGATRYLTSSQDGYDIVVGTTKELSTRPRFGFFESGAAASIARAKRNARTAIAQTAGGRRYYDAQILAVDGAIPGTDFEVCDVVNGRGYRNLGLDLEVTDIGGTQDEGGVVFSLALTVPV